MLRLGILENKNKKGRYRFQYRPSVLETPAKPLMEHGKPFVHEHIHLWGEDMNVPVEIQKLFQ